jgi:sulfur carrier protein
MKVIVNGSQTELEDGATIASLLAKMGLSGPVAVERNREVVPRAEHTSTVLSEGDLLEVVHFVGGG